MGKYWPAPRQVGKESMVPPNCRGRGDFSRILALSGAKYISYDEGGYFVEGGRGGSASSPWGKYTYIKPNIHMLK